MASPISTPGFPSVRARQSAATCDSAMETRVASLEAIIASLPSLIATAIDNALEKAFEKAFDASLEKFRREMLSRGAGEGISAPLAGDHHASPAIDPIQLPRSSICAEGARSHLSDDQLPRIDLDEEDNFDCVSELLESVDKVTDDDDSDDIVVISEVNSKPSQKSSKRTVADDDDDCVVLDGDPDKPVSVVEDSGSGSDELLVVGETGQHVETTLIHDIFVPNSLSKLPGPRTTVIFVIVMSVTRWHHVYIGPLIIVMPRMKKRCIEHGEKYSRHGKLVRILAGKLVSNSLRFSNLPFSNLSFSSHLLSSVAGYEPPSLLKRKNLFDTTCD
ncbi:hypothetical protein D8674_040007 [Pyrus ussuriensis x Pyrus communis]|uniref:Uncharacterized protein n=1 Tax=Pyrus ussuriensis x Pyrus communis TaxID=2448454 RepID=A0A5N5HB69_9ROSA|nr:hypothetical protein D8674_040007 [Pyrus ussuriensis x Pyrus communis]